MQGSEKVMNIEKIMVDNEKIKEILEISNELNLIAKYKTELHNYVFNSQEIIDFVHKIVNKYRTKVEVRYLYTGKEYDQLGFSLLDYLNSAEFIIRQYSLEKAKTETVKELKNTFSKIANS